MTRLNLNQAGVTGKTITLMIRHGLLEEFGENDWALKCRPTNKGCQAYTSGIYEVEA